MDIQLSTGSGPASTDPSWRTRLARFFHWPTDPRQRRWARVGVTLLILLIVGGLVWWAWHRQQKNIQPEATTNTASNAIEKAQAPQTAISALDGKPYDPALTSRRPLAIMVENHPDARPQYGLSRASVVYDAVAEGGITRYMAVFGPQDSDKVGPIRSARTYYIDWALEYNAVYIHAGGSSPALAKLSSDKTINQVDQLTSPYMWRQPHNGVATEHTLYGSTPQLRTYATNQKWSMTIDVPSWKFEADARSEADRAAAPVKTVTIPFGSSLFSVVYTYDPAADVWRRALAGLADKDAQTGEQISPTNVVIQVMQRTDIVEPGNKTIGVLTLYGSGPAWVAKGGQVIKGTWKKEAERKRTRYYDDQGNEIPLYPGQTYVEVIQPDTTPVFK